MDALLTRLHEERLGLWEQQKAALDAASAAGRTHLDGEDQAAYDRRDARMAAIDERVTELAAARQRQTDAMAAFDTLFATPRTTPAPTGADGDMTAKLRAFFRGETGRAFEITADDGPGPWRRSAAEVRDLTVGTTTAGGHTVPQSFYARLQAHLIEVSGIMMAAPTTLNTDSGEEIRIPKTTSHSSAVLVGEGVALTESDPAFAQAVLNAYKYGLLLQISRELVEDTGVDLLGYLAMQAGRALGNAFGAHAITGDGSSKPQGIVPVASTGVTGAATVAGVFTADNIIDLFHSVISPYRASLSCAWLMRDATVAAVRKLKDSAGQYIWNPSTTPGAPDTLLGKPLHTDPNVAAVAAAAKSVLFGDFSQFFVRFVRGARFERSDDYAFANDLITYRALIRADSELVDTTGAVKVFVGGAA